jgi:hypothetical protein
MSSSICTEVRDGTTRAATLLWYSAATHEAMVANAAAVSAKFAASVVTGVSHLECASKASTAHALAETAAAFAAATQAPVACRISSRDTPTIGLDPGRGVRRADRSLWSKSTVKFNFSATSEAFFAVVTVFFVVAVVDDTMEVETATAVAAARMRDRPSGLAEGSSCVAVAVGT